MTAETTTATGPTTEASDTRGIIPILLLAAFTVILNETVMSVAVPTLMAYFEVTATSAQWLTTAFMLTMAVVIPISGFILQRLTTRTVFITAMVLFSTGTLVAATAQQFWVLILARVIQASGTAVMMPLLMTTILTLVPVHRRGLVMGNVAIVMSVAPALGPTVSGIILETLGWRWIYGVVLPIALGMLVAGVLRLKNFGTPRQTRIDPLSVVLSAFGFGGLIYALTRIEHSVGGNPGELLLPLSVGLISLTLFVFRQLRLQREDRPLLDLRTFSHRPFVLGLSVLMISFFALMGVGILIPIYAQQVRGLDTLTIGLLMLPGGLLMGLLGPVIGRLHDAVGPRVLAVPGAIGVTAMMLMMTRYDESTPVWLMMAVMGLMMVSLAFTFTPTMTAALNALPPHQYSHGSALVGTLQQVAGAAGTALLVTVMALGQSRQMAAGVDPVAAQLSGVHTAITVGVCFAFTAVVIAFFLPGRPPRIDAEETPATTAMH